MVFTRSRSAYAPLSEWSIHFRDLYAAVFPQGEITESVRHNGLKTPIQLPLAERISTSSHPAELRQLLFPRGKDGWLCRYARSRASVLWQHRQKRRIVLPPPWIARTGEFAGLPQYHNTQLWKWRTRQLHCLSLVNTIVASCVGLVTLWSRGAPMFPWWWWGNQLAVNHVDGGCAAR